MHYSYIYNCLIKEYSVAIGRSLEWNFLNLLLAAFIMFGIQLVFD